MYLPPAQTEEVRPVKQVHYLVFKTLHGHGVYQEHIEELGVHLKTA